MATSHKTFCFMDLPGELRNKVYSFCNNDSIVDMKRSQEIQPELEIDRTRHQFLGLTQFGWTREIYHFLKSVRFASSILAEDGVETSKGHSFARIILDLSPGANDPEDHTIDILPLLRMRLADPGLICEFDFSTDIDTTYVNQICDHSLTQTYGSVLLLDLNKILNEPKKLATYGQHNNSLEAAILHLKALGAIRSGHGSIGVLISQPYLNLQLAEQPPWVPVRTGTIPQWAAPRVLKFVEDAGLTGIHVLQIRTNRY